MRKVDEAIRNRLGGHAKSVAAVLAFVLLFVAWLACRLLHIGHPGLLLLAVPVLFGASYIGVWTGMAMAVVAAAAWSLPWLSGGVTGGPFSPVWDFLTGWGVLTLLAGLESARRHAVERQRMLSRTDPLTGADNSRSFLEKTEEEIQRIGRHDRPLTLVYLDVDNFKEANDACGHSVGDGLLCAVAGILLAGTRTTDVVARMGGDEFALLLPETGQEEAERVLDRIRNDLDFIVRKGAWPIGFSMGCVTCAVPPPSAEAILQHADATMYAAKNRGKNRTVFSVYP